MSDNASDLARRMARQAEAVCRHYLSNGRREGRYWLIGDARNTPGRSMFVRLKGVESGKGAAGKWTDAATGEHGDLLDVIREAGGLVDFKDVAEEARPFPQPSASRASGNQVAAASADRIAGGGTPALRHVANDPGHGRGNVLTPTRHHGFARNRIAALPSPMLLQAGRAQSDRELAGNDRIRHRSWRPHHWRASYLACTRRQRQGAGRYAQAGDGRPPWPRSPVRRVA